MHYNFPLDLIFVVLFYWQKRSVEPPWLRTGIILRCLSYWLNYKNKSQYTLYPLISKT